MNIKKLALVACSNGQSRGDNTIEKLKNILKDIDIEAVESPCLYARDGVAAGTCRERAEVVNHFYRDDSIDAIFDISGGDIANEVLPYLDYELIGKSEKLFFGYSDLTTVLNAIYSQTGRKTILFQLKTILWDESGEQYERFEKLLQGDDELFKPKWRVLQHGYSMGEHDYNDNNVKTTPQNNADTILVNHFLEHETILGGNIRCFLKLAGTKYFPDLQDKVLFLEARSGKEAQIRTYMAQLYQLGAFEKVKAVLLGTFSEMEWTGQGHKVYEILKEYLPEDMLVGQTKEVGHGENSKAMWIGENRI